MPLPLEQDTRLREEMTRILRHADFQRSPVMAKLLSFLVEYCIEHDRRGPKAYTVAVEGLGRDPDFDPNSDSYPRVQVGRLRKMLQAYYAANPRQPQIHIPLGQYCTVLTEAAQEAEAAPAAISTPAGESVEPTSSPAFRWPFGAKATAIAAFAALVLIALVWMFARSDNVTVASPQSVQRPSLMISAPVAGEGVSSGELAALDSAFRDRFRRFGNVRIDTTTSSSSGGASRPDYVLAPVVQRAGGGLQVSVTLNRLTDNTTLWSDSFAVAPSAAETSLDIGRVAAQLAGNYGVIAHDQLSIRQNDFSAGYPCLVQFQSFIAVRDDSKLPAISKCLEQMAKEQIMPADALAAQSFLAFAKGNILGDAKLKAQGVELAARAYRLEPTKPSTIFAVARSGFFSGDCSASKAAGDRAISANPYDADLLGFHAVYMAGCNDPAAEATARRAIALDPTGSINAQSVLIFMLLRDKRYDEALKMYHQVPPALYDDPRQQLMQSLVLAVENDLGGAKKKWAALAGRYKVSPDKPQLVLPHFVTSASSRAAIEKMLRDLKIV